jgi:hypothetical protein
MLEGVIAQYDASLINDPQKRSDFEDEFELVSQDVEKITRDVELLDDQRRFRNSWLPYLQAINDSRPVRGLAVSLMESIVIGADTNTGVNAWRVAAGDAPAAKAAAAQPAAPAAPKPASGGGRFGNLDSLNLSAIGGGSSRGGGGAAGEVRGFPGIAPHLLVEPNGIALVGYADSLEAVREFEENLKNTKVFVDVRVDQLFYDLVPDSELATPRVSSPVSESSSGRSGSGRGSGKSGGKSIGLGNLDSIAIAAPSTPQGRPGAPVGTGQEIMVFHIDVQFVGKPNPRPQGGQP